MLGASTEKVKAQSMAEVEASAAFDAKAKGPRRRATGEGRPPAEPGGTGRFGRYAAVPGHRPEAAERTTGLRPFDAAARGAGMLAGDVIEMATGEGKTLSGAIAAAGYALAGRNVHVVTINDYLARRDAEWMGPLIEAMV